MIGGVQSETSEHQLEEPGAPAARLPGRGDRGHNHANDPGRHREFPFAHRFDGPPGTIGNVGKPPAQTRHGMLSKGPEGEDLFKSRSGGAAWRGGRERPGRCRAVPL